MARAGAHYAGIDVTERHLDLPRCKFRLYSLGEPHLLKGDLLTLAIPGRFDFVYSFGVLHHVPQERHYMERFRDLLADEARLLISVHSKYSLFNAYLAATWLTRVLRLSMRGVAKLPSSAPSVLLSPFALDPTTQ
jgi:SAM-dependent methyltransferase